MKKQALILILFLSIQLLNAQIRSITFSDHVLAVYGIGLADGTSFSFNQPQPFFSLLLDEKMVNTRSLNFNGAGFKLTDSIEGLIKPDTSCHKGLKYLVRFINKGKGNHTIENLVPMLFMT